DFEEKLIDTEVLDNMEKAKEVIKRSLELRDNAQIPVRQVLNKINLKGVNLDKGMLDLIAEAINVKEIVIEKQEGSEFLVELDTEITPTLKLEGIARNIIRYLNNYRKQLNLSTKNRINLYINTDNKEILDALETHEERIKKMIQADQIIQSLEGKKDIKKLKIENNIVEAFIEVKH
ncbi:MAG: DUF5915 domain-containing protein, partial [Candidatus Lokiarchaeia archaeon]|nr:DUF5915 domain-containing protein [Candidatus Lokiarchaeia archaeon]